MAGADRLESHRRPNLPNWRRVAGKSKGEHPGDLVNLALGGKFHRPPPGNLALGGGMYPVSSHEIARPPAVSRPLPGDLPPIRPPGGGRLGIRWNLPENCPIASGAAGSEMSPCADDQLLRPK